MAPLNWRAPLRSRIATRSVFSAVLMVAGWMLEDRIGGIIFFTPAQIAGFIGFCVLLGLVGSWAAMRKYLTLRSDI